MSFSLPPPGLLEGAVDGARRTVEGPHVGPPELASARAPKYVYSFANGKADGSSALRPPAGRQGVRAGRDDQAGRAGAARLHHHDRGLGRLHAAGKKHPAGLWKQVMARPGPARGRRGQPARAIRQRPLLVSVRSGARASMPGMMDTVLNLGLNDRTVEGLAQRTKNERFAWDCYRRFITLFGDVVLGIDRRAFDALLDAAKARAKARTDADLPADALRALVAELKAAGAGEDRAAVPAGSARAAAPGHQRGVRLLVGQEGGGLPAHQPAARRLGHRGDRDGDGVRQPRADLGHRGLLLARPVERRAALLRRVPRQRPGRGRGGGHPHPGADRRAQAEDARGLRQARRRSRTGSSATTATCRTSSSPCRRGGSTSSRRAPASGPARPRCASRWRCPANGRSGSTATPRSCASSRPRSTSSW